MKILKKLYNINGLDCPNCAAKLEKLMQEATGCGIKINFLAERLTVETEGDIQDVEKLTDDLARVAREFSKNVTVVPQ